MKPSILAARAAGLLLISLLSPPAAAQCHNAWRPGEGPPGVAGTVYCSTMWDPDGPGPAPEVLVVAGVFFLVGTQTFHSIAVYDLASGLWSDLGSGAGTQFPVVYALTAMPNGDLVAGGLFSTIDGVPANNIARWDGTAWSPLGAGLTSSMYSSAHVRALTVRPNGKLVAGGKFTTAGNVAAYFIAEWNGSSWSPLGSGLDGTATSFATLPNGNLIVGGDFSRAGSLAVGGIASWNGASWGSLGALYGTCSALAVAANGDLIVGGGVASIVQSNVARWTGTTWQRLGNIGSFSGDVLSLEVLANGDILVAGQFYGVYLAPNSPSWMPARSVLRWDGTTWSQLGNGIGIGGSIVASAAVRTITPLPSGDVVFAGSFESASGVAAASIARWDGSAWSPLMTSATVDRPVEAMLVMPNGDLIIGGKFATAGATVAHAVARWNGSSWSPLGAGLGTGATEEVAAMTTLPNGHLVVGGDLRGFNGTSAPPGNIVRWDGAAWQRLGTGVNGLVTALATLPGGECVAGGAFTTAGGAPALRIAAWNGTAWNALGAGMSGPVAALLVMPNGDLIAGGQFTMAGGVAANRIARWNGTAWSTLGTGLDGAVSALAVLPNRDLVVGGSFASAGGAPAANIARWDGSSWWPIGGGMNAAVQCLTTLPGGDLVAGGAFVMAGGQPANRIARWNGTSWSTFGAGADRPIAAMAILPDGDLAVGGSFAMIDGAVSLCIGRLTTTCPAGVATGTTGCLGPTGQPLLLSTPGLPWTGSAFPCRATGFVANSFGAALLGLNTQSIPLSTLDPSGLPNCHLLVTTESVSLLLPNAGVAAFTLAIPNSSVLAGVVLKQQVIQLGVSTQGALTSLSSSNALTLTIGTF